MSVSIPRLVIAAPSSGSGKSTIASGLMAALAQETTVQGFKVGPDYIDPGYHTLATGRASRNLDTWMVEPQEVRRSFARGVEGAGVAIVEGVMGLYDGYEATSERGSTAEVAKLIDAPVILVINAAKMARSAGAVALGYRDFDPALNLSGVICNNTGSPKHALWVTQAVESVGIPVLGCTPRTPDLAIPERHLGLHTANERSAEVEIFLKRAASLVREHIDLEQIWEIARSVSPLDARLDPISPPIEPKARIAVARDQAFCFYYEENFDLLRAAGAELVFFSPLQDDSLPKDIHGIYLGGGYPELYAPQLSSNRSMVNAIHNAVQTDMPLYAECGGLMYLTESITDLDGQLYPMVGAVPGRSQMVGKLTMGYRQVTALGDSVLAAPGDQFRGHEFHYSDWLDRPTSIPHAYAISPRMSETVRCEGFSQGNLLASYIHVHFRTRPELAGNFVESCKRWRVRP